MKKEKTFNFIFIILVSYILFGLSINVDALSCVYEYSDNNNEIKVTLKATELVEKANLIIDESKDHYYKMRQRGDMVTHTLLPNQEYDLKLFYTDCPTIAVYNGATGKYIYNSPAECKDVHPFACSDGGIQIEGELQLEEGEKIAKPSCTEKKGQEFAKEEQNIYQETINKKYNEQHQKILNYNFNINGDIDGQTKEIMSYIDEFGKSADDYNNDISALYEKYDCAPQNIQDRSIDFSSNLEKLKEVVNNKLGASAQIADESGNSELANTIRNASSEINDHIDDAKDSGADKLQENNEPSSLGGAKVDTTCEGILGDTIDIINEVLGWVQILAPVLLILFGILDFSKAVMANDDNALKKATSNFGKRAIAAVGVFLVPFMINLLLGLEGIRDVLGNGLCEGIGKVIIK